MAVSYTKKNGLLYSQDLHTVIGIDSDSSEFTGRIPFGAHEISENVFSGSDYESISIPDSVKELPPCLFENLTAVKNVKLPLSLTQLPPYLFSGCKSLVKVTMPENFTVLEEGFFYGCSSLTEIPFKAGVQEIGENACEGCTSVMSVIVPNTVVKIASRAFGDCKNLRTVVLPSRLYELAEDAFEGCDNIRSVRIDADNHLFYVDEEDGCLYEKTIDSTGDTVAKLRIKVVDKPAFGAGLIIEEGFDDSKNLSDDENLFILEDELEEDDTFSPEIEFSDEENFEAEIVETEIEKKENIEQKREDDNMENQNDVDAMFADIMSDEKERNSSAADVGVSEDESKVLTEMMDVMKDSSTSSNNGAVTDDELANLFASHEEEATKDNAAEGNDGAIDSKTQILIDSVKVSKVIECHPEGDSPEDSDLFVIAEKTVTNANGEAEFSNKLLNCAKKIASVQDLKRIIFISGLPLDNDEFMQFYFHFINKRNVVLACEAASPSELSDYCKTICEQSRISLDKNDLLEQRKAVGIKNNSLIKLIVKDVY